MIQSLESLLVASIPEGDRELLRHGAVLQYVTKDLAFAATGSEDQADRLLAHPFLEGNGAVRTIPIELRRELLKGWDEQQATQVLQQVVTEAPEDDPLYARLYARLASTAQRQDALRDLANAVDTALSADEPDVGRAHDLASLLDQWPIDGDPAAIAVRDDELAPRIRRYARAARDREITSRYLERDFEGRARELLLANTDQWMLQLHAPGGRGKTMFLRNFLGRYCPQHDIPVARIDFDYVAHIVTVTREPWRLLLAIARQLDPQLPGSPFRFMLESYGSFQALLFAEALPRRRSSGELDDAWSADSAAFGAEQDVPRQFRGELSGALGDRAVVVVLDTLENVLHTQGASVDTLLAAFDELRNHPSEGVSGLRLLLSGRFDLQGIHQGAGGEAQARAASFQKTWVGKQVRTEPAGDTELLIGRHVVSVELPPFSVDDSMSYLEDACDLRGRADPALLDIIVERCAGNPLKLALLAEQVRSDPPLTAADVAAFESVELFVLVDRIVDRLPDVELQWLLRWGVLTHVLTRDFAEGVIWPALIDFVEHRLAYDDPTKDGIPQSRHEVTRWGKPQIAALKSPGAERAAWNRLMEYAAESSWVREADGLSDAVLFHPETRDPLRRLLRQGGHPAYHDIHARALRYWQDRLDTDDPGERAVAVRGVMFHAFQPWIGERPSAESLWNDLLERFANDRRARAETAEELLQAACRPEVDASERPPAEAIARAHLELGEQLVTEAAKAGRPVDEARLSTETEAAEALAEGFERRLGFLRAALHVARGDDGTGWALFVEAMKSADTDQPAHGDLVASWLSTLTPPTNALRTVRQLAEAAHGGSSRHNLYSALARGLIARERWGGALKAARIGGQQDLEAAALLGQGRASAVLSDLNFEALRRAEAALLRYDPERAMQLLADVPPGGRRLFLEGQTQLLSGNREAAGSSYSSAAYGDDHVVAVEAVLALVRLLIDEGKSLEALHELGRLQGVTRTAALRMTALEAVAAHTSKEVRSLRPGTADMLRDAAGDPSVPPSIAVEIELNRLEAGLEEQYVALGKALARVEAGGTRLLAARGMARLRSGRIEMAGALPKIADRIRTHLAKVAAPYRSEPAQAVGAAELLRVCGFCYDALELLHKAAGYSSWPPLAHRAIADARERCEDPYPSAKAMLSSKARDPAAADPAPPPETPHRPRIRLSAGEEPGSIRARLDFPLAGAEAVVGPKDFAHPLFADAPSAMVKSPNDLFEALGQAMVVGGVPDLTELADHDEALELELVDEKAVRLPWELATRDGVPLRSKLALVRRVPLREWLAEDKTLLDSPNVLLAVSAERKDRGHVQEIIAGAYGKTDRLRSKEGPFYPNPETRIVHMVAEFFQGRAGAGILLDRNFLTAHNLAHWLGPGDTRRLLVLDLALASGDTSAAEQLMLANSFVWTLVASAPRVSVLCGVFAAGNDHIGRLPVLAKLLTEGTPLWRIAGALQRLREPLPRGGHPLRDAVSLVTTAPDRRFRLLEEPK